MKCPACDSNLQEIQVSDLAVDVCQNGCGRIWFDNFELEKVDEKHDTLGEELLQIPRNQNLKVDPSQQRPCPKCENIQMMKHYASVKREVEIDECPSCGGTWLDCGELRQIRQQYATDEDREKAAHSYFSEIFDDQLAQMQTESKSELKQANKFAKMFRFICPSYYIPGEQEWGAF